MARAICGVIPVVAICCLALLATAQITFPPEVKALRAIRDKLQDPSNNLNWTKSSDPCTSNWTGVFCYLDHSDGYLHVGELRMLKLNLFGELASELGELSFMTILNFMWNHISGSIPKEISNLSNLKYLLLSGNNLTGPLPDELGYLPNLLILQVDDNNITGQLPKSFANLQSVKHFHLNNNSISGQIPSELSTLPQLLHLSLRNCGLQGPVPDLSSIKHLRYIDLSSNQLTGMIPTNKLSDNITAVYSQPEVPRSQTSFKVPIKTGSVKDFSFEELEEATSGFSITTQVGQGGYGEVYKGVLADGTVVAIKRARQGSLQSQAEFITEIELLSRLHHRNLVSLVGYCDEQGEQMLVYEFMPNGSLHDLLCGSRNSLSSATRLHIALGSAKGILYLHTEADPPIIHRDIKANNILLDNKLNPKVSDFGISRLAPVTDGEGASAHVSTNVKGTPGYLDPEYFLTHKLTEKSDVYSLGIVFLQLLTGMRPISHGRNIVREVSAACQSGMMLSMIDPSMGLYSPECIKKFMALALKCTHDKPQPRPTMLEVVRELENLIASLKDSETAPSDSDASGSGVSLGIGIALPHVSSDKSAHDHELGEFMGSNLISGVIPTIRPR
ncbi:hypothetical protein SLEP1_g15347 [Rubroshorea leprosula]|uniref:non-specific serine/threonine protein kinase n=1 Tax=Rubroshorea leprosula TaxID=152421 RepID=A0AAV5IM31_9ROSI|nr:hypothetical protein SLEP1_g15347 [Rubroshorea leprosula]